MELTSKMFKHTSLTKSVKMDDFTYSKLKEIARVLKTSTDNVVSDLILQRYIDLENQGAFK